MTDYYSQTEIDLSTKKQKENGMDTQRDALKIRKKVMIIKIFFVLTKIKADTKSGKLL